jgi:KaiC/GvpD/RAD55 family RecA-like ATPase
MDNAGKIFLELEDEALDKLLAADKGESGLCVGRAKAARAGKPVRKLDFIETSIVVIEGGAGTGKTTLALQIASKVAKKGNHWGVIFLGLEQSENSLRNVVKSFGFGNTSMFPEQADSASDKPNEVRFCRLSPLPLSEQQADATFETRFAELQHMVLKQSGIDGYNSLFVIDSLNAFTGHPLTRSQLYQLFALFRAQKIPLIVTLEQPEKLNSAGNPEIETACFLSDVVIKLTREPGSGYLQFFLEISKSRVCRQGLGKHLYKTRTVKNAEETGTPTGVPAGSPKDKRKGRTGVVVYPSVHFIISQARLKPDWDSSAQQVAPSGTGKKFIIAAELHNEQQFDLESEIKSPACFALQGPAGTHKLALGLNLGISYVPQDNNNKELKAKLLVVTFGGQGEIDFKGVAWLESQDYLWGLKRTESSETQSYGTKQTLISYSINNSQREENITKSAEVTVLTFQIGVLTPEECIYRINKVMKEQEGDGKPFHSVLISDTAELCTGFPLLSKDPMFFTALLDLFETKGLLTVGLGVLSSDSPSLRDINLALMAKATHRMRFYHYPEVEELMKEMVNKKRGKDEPQDKEPIPLTEQRVSVVIDNVTGKNYKRQPKWISVKGDKPKILECLPFAKPKIE